MINAKRSVATALTLIVTACGGATEAPTPTPEPGFPSQPPAPLPVRDVAFPDYAERTLRNGARLLVVENDEQPVVSITLLMPGGSMADPEGKSGLASLTASLTDKGTESMDAKQLAEAADFIGANLGAGASAEWSSVNLTVITVFLDRGLELMSDVVLNPTFPEEELRTEKQRRISALRLNQSQPGVLAQQTFTRELYGEHPYGDFETPETIEAIQAADLESYHRARYRPGQALFVVAGAVDPAEIARKLELAFAGWEGSPPAATSPSAPPARASRELIFVHKPGSVQAVIRLGHLFPTANEGDWATFDVANQVLGAGGFTSWMMKILREEKGYTYGARSTMAERVGPGFFMLNGEFRNEVADSSLAIMLDLAERLRAGNIPDADLEAAKLYMTGRFPRMIETPGQVASQVASNRLLGRPDSYLQEYRTRVAEVEKDDIADAAQRYIRPDDMLIVVVGDAGEVLSQVRPFADRVRVVDTEGRPVDVAALEAAAAASAALTFDASGLEPRRLTYGVVYQGNEVGTAVTEWSREGDVFVAVSEQRLPGVTLIETTRFDARTFAPHSTMMNVGPMGEFAVTVSEGQATGKAFSPQGPQDVDVAVPEGGMLSGMDDVAMALHDFDGVDEVTLRVLSGSGQFQGSTVKKSGEETVEVPAGTFETWRLEVSGEQPMTVWVTKSAPHVVVKRALVQPPLEVVLKEMN